MRDTVQTKALEELVADVATDEEFKKYAMGIVRRHLGGHISGGEVEVITEDAISDQSLKTIERLRAGNTELKEMVEEDGGLNGEAGSRIRKYLSLGVKGYCEDRRRRWAYGSKTEKPGARARKLAPEDENLDEPFWGSVFAETEGKAFTDGELEDLFRNHGLSETEGKFIRDRRDGMTYQQMAVEYGGSADKYRKTIKRALTKLQGHG